MKRMGTVIPNTIVTDSITYTATYAFEATRPTQAEALRALAYQIDSDSDALLDEADRLDREGE